MVALSHHHYSDRPVRHLNGYRLAAFALACTPWALGWLVYLMVRQA